MMIVNKDRKVADPRDVAYILNIRDVLAAQNYPQILSHVDCVNRYGITLFVELGMYMGGTLPHLIPNLVLDDRFSYLGFEILPEAVKPQIKAFASTNPRCQVILGDMFKYIDLVAEKIAASAGPAYIFCDGGNKPKELITFSKLMRVGDIISVHDWTEDQTGEITDRDIEQLSDDFETLDEEWRWGLIWLPTFIKVR